MIDRLNLAARPFAVVKVAGADPFMDRLDAYVNSLFGVTSFILPAGAQIEFIKSRNAVRVVAGKGGRRRGVRDRLPPLRVVTYPTEGALSQRARLRAWWDRPLPA